MPTPKDRRPPTWHKRALPLDMRIGYARGWYSPIRRRQLYDPDRSKAGDTGKKYGLLISPIVVIALLAAWSFLDYGDLRDAMQSWLVVVVITVPFVCAVIGLSVGRLLYTLDRKPDQL